MAIDIQEFREQTEILEWLLNKGFYFEDAMLISAGAVLEGNFTTAYFKFKDKEIDKVEIKEKERGAIIHPDSNSITLEGVKITVDKSYLKELMRAYLNFAISNKNQVKWIEEEAIDKFLETWDK